MITQHTTQINGHVCRLYEANGRIALVFANGNVYGYLTLDALVDGDIDYLDIDRHSTNEANRLAIDYVKGGD